MMMMMVVYVGWIGRSETSEDACECVKGIGEDGMVWMIDVNFFPFFFGQQGARPEVEGTSEVCDGRRHTGVRRCHDDDSRVDGVTTALVVVRDGPQTFCGHRSHPSNGDDDVALLPTPSWPHRPLSPHTRYPRRRLRRRRLLPDLHRRPRQVWPIENHHFHPFFEEREEDVLIRCFCFLEGE